MSLDNYTNKDWKVYSKNLSHNEVRQHWIKVGRRPDKPDHNWIAINGMPGANNCKCSVCGKRYMDSFHGDWCDGAK